MPRAKLNPRFAPRLADMRAAVVQREAKIDIEQATLPIEQSLQGIDIDGINATLADYETRLTNLETP